MKRYIFIILCVFVSAQLFSASHGICKEYDFVYGNETIFKDTTWHGTVFIGGVVTVFEGITLTIKPGTVIMFKKIDTNNNGFGENEMYVRGEIVAEGTKAEPIIFTSAQEVKKPGDWIAINMMVSEGKRNIFKNCVIEYSLHGFHAHFSDMNLVDCDMRQNFLAVQFQDSDVKIKGCDIHDNNQGIQFRDSNLTMENTKLIGNEIGMRCVYSEVELNDIKIIGCSMPAIQIRGSTVDIKGGTFSDSRAGITAQDSKIILKKSMVLNNLEDGLSLHNSDILMENSYVMLNGDDGILIENSTVVIRENNIFNNAKYNVTLEQEEGIDASKNYWGTDDVDKIDLFNYDKKDLGSLGEIKIGEFYKTEIGIAR